MTTVVIQKLNQSNQVFNLLVPRAGKYFVINKLDIRGGASIAGPDEFVLFEGEERNASGQRNLLFRAEVGANQVIHIDGLSIPVVKDKLFLNTGSRVDPVYLHIFGEWIDEA